MAKKMLGKVVAGAALGGASLLVFTPGIALADGQPHENEGKVFAKPHAVKPGEEVKLVEICPKPQEEAFVWSKVTGKVKLEPARGDHEEDRGGWIGEDSVDERGAGRWQEDRAPEHGEYGKDGKDHEEPDWKGPDGKGPDGKGHEEGKGPEEGKGHEEPDWKGPDGKGHEEGKGPEEGKGHEEAPKPEPKGGAGGGAAADGEHDWKGEEHGQDAEGPKYDERTGPEGDERGEYSREGEKPGEHGREGAKPGEGPGHEGEWWADRSWEREAEHAEGDRWEKGKDFVYYGEARVAEDAKPGTYKLEGSCGEGELVVLPHGGVKAGDGGAAGGADRGLATAGAGLVGAAALGGLVLLRRRRADEFAA